MCRDQKSQIGLHTKMEDAFCEAVCLKAVKASCKLSTIGPLPLLSFNASFNAAAPAADKEILKKTCDAFD